MSPQKIFLRGIWKLIPCEDDLSWVDRIAEQPHSNEPMGDYGSLVNKMLSLGLSKYEIARFAKLIGYEMAFSTCYHLEDPVASYEGFDNDDEKIEWSLYQSKDDKPLNLMRGLHESILSMDPTGREMRPDATHNQVDPAEDKTRSR